jgi:hypothetical protein
MSDASLDQPTPSTWLLLTFGDSRQYAGNLGYEDDPTRVYRYDSFVPNHLQLASGDVGVIQGHDRAVGYARIERIDAVRGQKDRQRCPECGTTALKSRRVKRPLYRCDHGHEFDEPRTEAVDCTLYAAHFGDSFEPASGSIDSSVFRRACIEYNGQLAMQRLDPDRLEGGDAAEARVILRRLLRGMIAYVDASEAAPSPAAHSSQSERLFRAFRTPHRSGATFF